MFSQLHLNTASAINFSFVDQNYQKEESKLRDRLKGGRVTIVLQTNRNKDNPPQKVTIKISMGLKTSMRPNQWLTVLISKSHHKENIYICQAHLVSKAFTTQIFSTSPDSLLIVQQICFFN